MTLEYIIKFSIDCHRKGMVPGKAWYWEDYPYSKYLMYILLWSLHCNLVCSYKFAGKNMVWAHVSWINIFYIYDRFSVLNMQNANLSSQFYPVNYLHIYYLGKTCMSLQTYSISICNFQHEKRKIYFIIAVYPIELFT